MLIYLFHPYLVLPEFLILCILAIVLPAKFVARKRGRNSFASIVIDTFLWLALLALLIVLYHFLGLQPLLNYYF